MYFKQFYLGCLAQASYLIGDSGEAAVVDPRRDIDEYLAEAAANGLVIRHIIETHLHADFISGHRELARATGARIYFGKRAEPEFQYVPVGDGDELAIGGARLRFLETPGHTPESISVLVFDRADAPDPWGVLTGDTLFIGDVGRPDLAAGGSMTAKDLAGMLYDSLHKKLLILPDATRVFPGHGAGSLCGRNISSETSSTIGEQRKFNYALRPMSREEFVRMTTVDLPEAPAYFSRDAAANREGPDLLADLPEPRALSPEEVQRLGDSGAVLLDTRSAAEFGAGHVPGSLVIGLGGQFAAWAGALLTASRPIVLIAEGADKVAEARLRLARVGLDNVEGYLDGGVLAWEASGRPLSKTEQITVEELADRLSSGAAGQVVDVRRPGEWQTGRIRDAVPMTLAHLEAELSHLDRARAVTSICAGGYRSSIASSILERHGFALVTNVVGGMAAWTAAGYPMLSPER